MTSYLRYQKELRTVQDADDIESWITVRGNHIPIKKGQSKEDAVKSFLKSKGGNSSTKGSEQKNELSIAYHKDKGHIKEGNPPKGWTKVEGATTAPNGYSWYSNNKSMFGGERESYLYKDKPESSKKWSGAWSKRANKPESLGEASKKATEISKKQAEKKWSSAWKEQVKEDLAWFSKGKTAKQRQEAGYAALEIAYNIEFGKNAAKNRSALIKEVHNSGVEDPDYIEAILNNMEEKHFESQESFRKGLKNAKKKIEPSNKNLKED